jgi:hypothetical protein
MTIRNTKKNINCDNIILYGTPRIGERIRAGISRHGKFYTVITPVIRSFAIGENASAVFETAGKRYRAKTCICL